MPRVLHCLNPCFSGLYYLTHTKGDGEAWLQGLNPCFSGLYYLTFSEHPWFESNTQSLNPCFSGLYYLTLVKQG